MSDETILDRLDLFFGEGENTDAIGEFIWQNQDFIRSLDTSNDSQEALELYALFTRYSSVVENMMHTFMEREKASGDSSVSLEEMVAAVSNEFKQSQDSHRYLCTDYIAGALDFEAFKQLVADANEMLTYPVGEELDEGMSSLDCSQGEKLGETEE